MAGDTPQAQASRFTYLIRVGAVLDSTWCDWFDGMSLVPAESDTTISGPVRDMAQLHGVLTKVRDLGLTLLEVRQVEAPSLPRQRRDTSREVRGDG
jgi:hypothetical protein